MTRRRVRDNPCLGAGVVVRRLSEERRKSDRTYDEEWNPRQNRREFQHPQSRSFEQNGRVERRAR